MSRERYIDNASGKPLQEALEAALPVFHPNGAPDTRLFCGPSLTKQSFAEECDINVIMDRAVKSGYLPVVGGEPVFADVSFATDFKTAIDTVRSAYAKFDELPMAIKDFFHASPEAMIEFLSDPANRPKAVELGLVSAPAAEAGSGGGAAPAGKASGGAGGDEPPPKSAPKGAPQP